MDVWLATVPLVADEEEGAVKAEGGVSVVALLCSALLCIQEKPQHRPEVMTMLSSRKKGGAGQDMPRLETAGLFDACLQFW